MDGFGCKSALKSGVGLVFLTGLISMEANAAAVRVDPCAPPGEVVVALAVAGSSADCDTAAPVGVAQPGATNATLGGTASTIGSTIGGVVGGAFGGGAGGSTAAAGVSRYALQGQTGQAAAGGAPRWNLWAAYSHVAVGYSFQPLQSGGSSNLVLGGIDYMISNSLIAGVAITDERDRKSVV